MLLKQPTGRDTCMTAQRVMGAWQEDVPCLMRAFNSWMVCVSASLSLVRMWFCSCACLSLELCRTARCAVCLLHHHRHKVRFRRTQQALQAMFCCLQHAGRAVSMQAVIDKLSAVQATTAELRAVLATSCCLMQHACAAATTKLTGSLHKRPTIISLRWCVAC